MHAAVASHYWTGIMLGSVAEKAQVCKQWPYILGLISSTSCSPACRVQRVFLRTYLRIALISVFHAIINHWLLQHCVKFDLIIFLSLEPQPLNELWSFWRATRVKSSGVSRLQTIPRCPRPQQLTLPNPLAPRQQDYRWKSAMSRRLWSDIDQTLSQSKSRPLQRCLQAVSLTSSCAPTEPWYTRSSLCDCSYTG